MSGRSRVVVVGSGAAGLAAAVAAREGGAEVTLLERGVAAGGTTALSGGVAWLPGNHRAAEVGAQDTPAEAREYLRSLALGDVDEGLVGRVLRGRGPGGRASSRTPGGCAGTPSRTRTTTPSGRAGSWAAARSSRARWRPTPGSRRWCARRPTCSGRSPTPSWPRGSVDRAEVEERRARGILTLGRALVAALLGAVVRAGAEVRTRARARRLVVDDGAVVGVATDEGVVPGRSSSRAGGSSATRRSCAPSCGAP